MMSRLVRPAARPGDVVAGRLVELHPDDGAICRVGVSVAASIDGGPTSVVISDEAGIGQATQSFAKAASEHDRGYRRR